MRIALATCIRLPEPDADEAPLLDALRRRGVEATTLAWDDPGAQPGAFDLVVLRATWNYHLAPERFLAWAERTAGTCRLVNPLPVVRWNVHKGYLRELAAAGVAVVPTFWVGRGEAVSFTEVLRRTGWSDVVVKPAISAASYETWRFAAADARAAEATLRRLAAANDVIVQPYLRSIETSGERSLIWIAGQVTHAVQKRPRFAGGHERVASDLEPLPEERHLAAAALARWGDEALYARVDLMRDDDGRLLVSEVELIEPSLFFPLCGAALERFADILASRA